MFVPWMLVALCVSQCAGGGASLRGAVEALQRRQRSQYTPNNDYDLLYEFVPPGYSDPDYTEVVDYVDEEPMKFSSNLQEVREARPPDSYKYTMVQKRNLAKTNTHNKESAFRERSLLNNDKLKDIFADSDKPEEPKDEVLKERVKNYEEYNRLLSQFFPKFQSAKPIKPKESVPQGIVQLYNDKIVKKRYPDNWGPIAFKRKRSSGSEYDSNRVVYRFPREFDSESKQVLDPNYNSYDTSDDDNNDWHEEYTIAFQPLNEDVIAEIGDENRYSIDSLEKRFPVTKRSSGSYEMSNNKKRSDRISQLRSNSGTDPKIIKDLSKIFGEDAETIKTPVKRYAEHESLHETKPPKIAVMNHNSSHAISNYTRYEVDTHEQHESHMHHPGHEGMKEVELSKTIDHANHGEQNKQIIVKKKSIDWSDYFGIDKRAKKLLSDTKQDHLEQQYFNTFNKEVIHPLNSFRKHSYAKRNFDQVKPVQDSESHEVHATARNLAMKDKDSSRLENIDKKLRDMEGILVDEALHYSDKGEELDSTEEQQMKEKLLSELAAAYSTEKMRKALKELKQNLQAQKSSHSPPIPSEHMKSKRVAAKKELLTNDIPLYNKQTEKYDEFEGDQGAGHYLNGQEEQTEGYASSGRHRNPSASKVYPSSGNCPVLTKIVNRCRNVDILAGDHGQLFLPMCSLHQICYLCGEAPQTTCDLVFLSEADESCEGDMNCQQGARAALMSLRDLHDNLADELDGECEVSPCLSKTLQRNPRWQKALQR